jgi:hypothetical protein
LRAMDRSSGVSLVTSTATINRCRLGSCMGRDYEEENEDELRPGCQEGGGGVGGGVIEVDFFDEADGELIVGEVDVVGGVHAGLAVLAEPPEGERAENGDGFVGGSDCAVGFQDIGPDDRVTVEDGGAVGEALVNVCFGAGKRLFRRWS